MDKKRRQLLHILALSPGLLVFHSSGFNANIPQPAHRLQYSVNAYSFNQFLRSGEMTFFDMMEFAAEIGMDAVDLTGYYFSSYPEPPQDIELFQLKRKALEYGLNISWTGIRNDFVNPNPESRKADREMIKNWLNVSSKLGASIMRVFIGTSEHTGYSRDEVKDWIVEEFRICSEYAEASGVILGMQHHNDFLYNGNEIIDIVERVDSDWFGLILDTGSLHAEDPYEEMEKLAPYANYWFVKEFVYPGGNKETINMNRLAPILKTAGYQGYISFEYLGSDNPREGVTLLFNTFREAYG